MTTIAFIVERLNDKPFNMNLTLVGFDEKNNFELLEITNEIFTQLDKRHDTDLREETDEQRTYRFMDFLNLLKFPFPEDIDLFRDGLMQGDRNSVYPILHWALSDLNTHKKRAYLGKFLAPIQVPQEYLGDDSLNDTFLHYKSLQEEFKKLHKQVDQLRNNSNQPSELRKEIAQLDQEKHQLSDKIAGLKKRTQGEPDFNDLLQATSLLRKEQEEMSKLAERKKEQSLCLLQAEKAVNEVNKKLNITMQTLRDGISPEAMLEKLKKEVEEKKELLERTLPRETQQRLEKLKEYEKKLKEPVKTEADVNDLEDEIQVIKQQIHTYQDKISSLQNTSGDDKLAIFRQHASLQAKKRIEKEELLESAISEKERIQREIDEKETILSQMVGPKSMKREEFKTFTENLRMKTSQYKKMRKEMTELNSETSVLIRTEHILKGRDSDLNGFLKQLEDKKGVSGYMETQSKLNEISEMNAKINETKGKTLEEISRIVTDINQTLKEKKNSLAPQIKELRNVRQRYQEMEVEYLEKKAVYDNTAVGLESERMKLEQECDAFQEDCLREERRFHSLNCQINICQSNIEKMKMETDFDAGKGRLLRDFRTYKDLYKNKIQQQESLSKELRKQKRDLEENATSNMRQRQLFDDLKLLLECKLNTLGKGLNNTNKNQLDANIDNLDIGGANIMTIEA